MRIALVGPVYPYRGGIAHYTALLARHLRGHTVQLISFSRQYPGWLFPGRSDRDTSQDPLAAEGVSYDLDSLVPLSWWRTARKLRDMKPDVLLMQWWVTFWAPSFATVLFLFRRWVPGTPIVFICHNVLPHEPRYCDRELARMVLSFGTHFVVHSSEDRKHLLGIVPRASVSVVPFPGYGEVVTKRPGKRDARALLGLDPEEPTLLFFGFIRPYKGLQYLLRAMPEVRRQVPAHLLIVGEFWEKKEPYSELIKELALEPHVTIVDRYVPNEDLGMYLAAADAAVLPYVQTSQSAAARLALDAGLPVIASRVGGLGEMIEIGVNGFLTEPCNVASLADTILRFFRDGLNAKTPDEPSGARETDGWQRIVRTLESLGASSSTKASP